MRPHAQLPALRRAQARVVPAHERLPGYLLDEIMLHNGCVHSSNEAYAMAKRVIDTPNRCYADQFSCHFTSVIRTARTTTSTLMTATRGKPLQQFISTHDAATLMLWVLGHYDNVEPPILSVDKENKVSIGDVVQEITRPWTSREKSTLMSAQRTATSK
ncbi:GDP-L-fucose synthetase [Phytophthora cinnamomi]|uniref:GDP-L-fucose synthetase n=1 Tax=Phytophthora cinnamomi TaxID=4785 RepID=UPI003559AF73|nr:GDP-L-fucose synthetase [Phytophthora cinnamomi]